MSIKKVLVFISLLLLVGFSKSRPLPFGIEYNFGINFMTPFIFGDIAHIPYGIDSVNYYQKQSTEKKNIIPFTNEQYTQIEKQDHYINNYDLQNPLIYDLTTSLSFVFEKHYLFRVNFDFLIANRREDSFTKYIILDASNNQNYIGTISTTRDYTFSAYGFTLGPEFQYRFNEGKRLPMSFFVGTSFNMGTFFILKKTTHSTGSVSLLGGSSPLYNSGNIKRPGDFIADGINRQSTYSSTQVVNYVNPFMFQSKTFIGVQTRLASKAAFQFFLGFTWSYLYIQRINISIKRETTLLSDNSKHKQSLSMSEPGFHKNVVSVFIGIGLTFKVTE